MVIFIIVIFFSAFVLINNYCISTTKAVFNTQQNNQKIRIVLISDLHGKYFGKDNINLCRAIKGQKPDIIAIAGDVVSNNGDYQAAVSLINGLNDFCDNIYFTNGNHENRFDAKQIERVIESQGATALNNKSITYTKNDTTLCIYGIDLPLFYYSGYKDDKLIYDLTNEDIESLIGKSSDENINVLIAHNPCYFESYSNWGADIVLSGHNHGGAIRIPFYGGIFTPNGDIKNKHYDCGEYNYGDSTMYLSRGLGEWIGPVRVFNLPEIYVIDIDADTEKEN